MKKLFLSLFTCIVLFSCNDQELKENILDNKNVEAFASRKNCPSEEIRKQNLNSNSVLYKKYIELEKNTEKYIQDVQLGKVLADGTVEIPVIVNVLYRTNQENISNDQINSQIAILNSDFGGTNSDINKIPTEFLSVAAGDTKVKFRLHAVNRKYSSKRSWRTNDDMKRSSKGGINATSPANYLNIWVVNDMSGVLGYATFPESAGLWNDGVVIVYKYFGKTAFAPYNLGRTATHEVGHYLNLRHIWGDTTCGNDFVADTPTQTGPNYGKPVYPVYNSCGGVNRSIMFMNYMDYVDDSAMFMFTNGQKIRMNAITASTGLRSGLRLY